MELLKIEVENFRQFYGKQSIEFSTGDSNITIILGENGMGKTGMFRALIFCLYGSRYLPQDDKNEDIHLVNMKKLQQGGPITSIVKVYIKRGLETLVVVRSIKGVKHNDNIIEDKDEVYLDLINSDGNYELKHETDSFKIEKIINNILDDKIKEFFLFDGEKIETLARTNKAVKEEVKTGIVKLMQIDKLEKAISITNSLLRKESEKIKDRSANIDLHNQEKAIKEAIKEIEEKEEIRQLKITNLTDLNEEINDIRSKLDENKEIREINKNIEGLKKDKNHKLDLLRVYKDSFNNGVFNDAQRLLMQDYYKSTKDELMQLLFKQKDLVPIEVIEKSLNTMYCLCCDSNLNDNNHAIEFLENLKMNHSRSEYTSLIRNIISRIEDFENKTSDVNKFLYSTLEKINVEKQEINRTDGEIENLLESIKGHSQKEEVLNRLEKNLEEKERLKHQTSVEIDHLSLISTNLEKELLVLQRNFDELLKKSAENEYEARRIEIIQNLNESLKKIFNEYSEETRILLSEETTRIFRRLIDNKDMSLINEIRINEKYEIEIFERSNIKITQDISQGQRQIVALSFVTALAKIADKGSGYIEFPLFMDTPFGRISKQNRTNLIKNIPNLSLQWILLLTDTEFTEHEAKVFKEEGKVGSIYKLIQVDEGHSKIEKINVSDYLSKGESKWIS